MRLISFCSVLVLVLLSGAVTSADQVTATNMNPGYVSTGWDIGVGYTNGQDYTNESAGQLFRATISGKLSTLYATVDRFEGGEPLNVSVFTADFNKGVGLPGTLLGSIAIPESQVTGFPPSSTWDLSSLNINLTAGESYIVTFTVRTALFQSVRFRALLTASNPNSFGVEALYSKDGTTRQPEGVTPEIGLIVSVASPPPPKQVAIDVDPASTDNKINLKTKNPNPLEIAVFGAADFDVFTVRPETILLGDPVLTDPESGTGIAPTSVTYDDVNGDGNADLVLTFDLAAMQSVSAIDSSTTSLEFAATLDNQGMVYGSDFVSVSGSQGKGKGKK